MAEISDVEGYQEAMQQRAGSSEKNKGVLQMLRSLNSAFVYPEAENWETNRKLWDQYAKDWGVDVPWVQKMASAVGQGHLGCLGEEWSSKDSLSHIISNFIQAYVSRDTVAAEIGSGGGRMAVRVAPMVSSLQCFDISIEMLKCAKAAVDKAALQNVSYVHMSAPQIADKFHGMFDFVYCFDVFVHMDLHTIWRSLQDIASMLKPGGFAFVSAANLLSSRGWQRFSKQRKYSVGGFYFISPDIFRHLVGQASLKIVKEHCSPLRSSTGNIYLDRDILLVLQRESEENNNSV